MEALVRHAGRGENRVALLAHDRQLIVDRGCAVLALVSGVMPEVLGDVLRLIDETAAHRAGVDLDQPDKIGILATNEMRDVIEHAATAAQVTRPRQRQMEGRSGPGGVADVVGKQAQT